MCFKKLLPVAILLMSSSIYAQEIQDVATFEAQYQVVPRIQIFDGTVEAVNEATVSAQTSGRITEVFYDVDDFVEKGQVLCIVKAMKLMNEAALENEHVLAEPPVSIIFDAFGDNALNLVLRCFVDSQDLRLVTITQLHEAINSKFNEAGICIAFPQRDVHLDASQPLEVRIRHDAGTGDATT